MIIDLIDNLSFYAALNPLIRDVCEFLQSTNLDKLSEGWHAVGDAGGEDVYAMVATENCRNDEDADIEAHHKYVDVQICLRGTDRIGWKPVAGCTDQVSEYEPEDDLIFYGDDPVAWIELKPGYFVMFFPSDGHKPLVGSGELKKLVFKMRQG